MEEKKITEQESLDLIAMMLNKAKDSYRDTGVSAILWGSVIAVCSLVKLSELHFGYSLPFDIYWLTLIAVIPQVYISVREKRARKVKTYDDVYLDYVWLAFAISVFLLSFIINNVFKVWEPVSADYAKIAGHASDFRLHEFVAPFFLLVYGIPTFITGAACKFRPMLLGGIVCWMFAVATIYTNIELDLLLTALAAIFAWLVPGLIMKRNNREAKKELAQSHV